MGAASAPLPGLWRPHPGLPNAANAGRMDALPTLPGCVQLLSVGQFPAQGSGSLQQPHPTPWGRGPHPLCSVLGCREQPVASLVPPPCWGW